MKLTTFLKMVMNTLTQKLKNLKKCNQIIIFLTGWGRKLRGQLKKRVLKQKKRVSNIKAKIEKIRIAPGEFGKFQN